MMPDWLREGKIALFWVFVITVPFTDSGTCWLQCAICRAGLRAGSASSEPGKGSAMCQNFLGRVSERIILHGTDHRLLPHCGRR